VDWLVLVVVLWLVFVTVLVTVTVTVFAEALVVLRAMAGMAIARHTRTTAAINTTKRDHLPPTRECLTSLAFSSAFIARLS
jgi:hypothetical protein